MTESRASWRSLFIEALVIVGSILLAFAIDAAWDARQERQELLEVLEGLSRELAENRELLAEARSGTSRAIELLIRVSAAPTDELVQIPAPDTYGEIYLPLVRTWDVTLSTGALRATISSGKLALIPDPDTRAALTSLEAALSEVPRLTAELDRMGAEAATLLGEFEGIQQMWTAEPYSLDAATIRAIHGNARLKGLANGRIIFSRGYLYVLDQTLGPRLERAIESIDAQLAELR